MSCNSCTAPISVPVSAPVGSCSGPGGCAQGQAPCTISPPRRTVERFRDPTPEPVIKRVVKRNPTPAGDVVERITVKRVPQTIIERITEQPTKPCPVVVERCETEGAPPPVVRDSCVYVEPSCRAGPGPAIQVCTANGCGPASCSVPVSCPAPCPAPCAPAPCSVPVSVACCAPPTPRPVVVSTTTCCAPTPRPVPAPCPAPCPPVCTVTVPSRPCC